LGPTQVKLPGHGADHSPPSAAEFKYAWSCASIPPYVFTVWCFIKYRILLHGVLLLLASFFNQCLSTHGRLKYWTDQAPSDKFPCFTTELNKPAQWSPRTRGAAASIRSQNKIFTSLRGVLRVVQYRATWNRNIWQLTERSAASELLCD